MRKELLAVSLKPDTVNKEARTIDLVWYTGAAVPRVNFWTDEPYTLAFSMDPKAVNIHRLNSGAPLLNSHRRESLENVLGVVRRGWIENGIGMATVEFSSRPEVDPFWNDVQSGIIQNISMGAYIGEIKDVTPKGSKMRTLMAAQWEPQELSIVPVGADPGAGFLSAEQGSSDDVRNFMERLIEDKKLAHLAMTGAASTADNEARAAAALVLGLKLRNQRQFERSL